MSSSWYETLMKDGPSVLKWPYPVRYGEERVVKTDVLVLGGGPAGSMAAVSAARNGARVVLVDKAHPKRSGGGSGVDHWVFTPNPCSKITAEECVQCEYESYNGYVNSLSRYIAARESYDTLLEIENMGGKIRDTEGEFTGAPFRDEETGFLFAYDYETRHFFRVWGTTFKPAMYRECRRVGVKIFERVMITCLLTEGGRPGRRVIGAAGFNNRTGEFLIFLAGATIDCMAFHEGNWQFSTELTGLPYFHPNVVCDGPAIAWRAGAEFTLMEKSSPAPPPGYHLPSYGSGNPKNTWYPCSMVDAEGKEIPWIDGLGNPINDIEQRTRPAPGQKFLGERAPGDPYRMPRLVDDLEERVRRGEFKLPLYADLPGMPEHERRAIWGLMVGQEGRSNIPIVRTYTKAGFDPDQDLLQSYFLLGGEPFPGMWQHSVLGFIRGRGPFASPGGLVTDWNLMTNLEGLFAAGNALYGGNFYNHAATTGRYAGRKAAAYARGASLPEMDRAQVEAEKTRIYAPVQRRGGIDWKELRAGLCRVMQNYCGEIKNRELLEIGLAWLDDIETNVSPEAFAPNPHVLMRVVESFHMLTCDRIIIQAGLARKASSRYLGFTRQDYPEQDPPKWHKFVTIRQAEDGIQVDVRDIDYAYPLGENYEAHNKEYKGYLNP